MALSAAFVDMHVAKWESRLHSVYPYRARWPSRLFHHAPIQNIFGILTGGGLRSRNDRLNGRVRDVAAAGVIDARTDAHEFARLYFRPRTPTQWHIEGIRKAGECRYGEDAHAPVLVMLVFDARRVLSQDGVRFCDRNMQLASAAAGDTEAYFSSIPFEKVYHEGRTNGDRSITEHRCAEVLVPSPLNLEAGSLQWIICRSEAERLTLVHLLGPSCARKWMSRIAVSNDLLVFEKKYVFVEEVSVTENGVVFKLFPRQDAREVDLRVVLSSNDGKQVINFHNPNITARPTAPGTHYRVPAVLAEGEYLAQIDLEGHCAFISKIRLGSGLF